MATPFPITAGKFADDASTVWPAAPLTTPEGGARKSNTNYIDEIVTFYARTELLTSSSFSKASRSVAVPAFRSRPTTSSDNWACTELARAANITTLNKAATSYIMIRKRVTEGTGKETRMETRGRVARGKTRYIRP